MKLFAGLAGGLFLGYVGSIFFQLAFATPQTKTAWNIGSLVVLWLIAIIFSLRSKSARKAWSKICATSAFMLFIIPIAAAQALDRAKDSATTVLSNDAQMNIRLAIGATIFNCVVMSIILTFIGYFLGREKNSINQN